MSEAYDECQDECQVVGLDLHRNRTVMMRMTRAGERLEAVRFADAPEVLVEQVGEAGRAPEVVVEATYGWYWAMDALQAMGASVHLAHPQGVKGFAYRRVKNDVRDAADLGDLLRMGRLPEAWIAPPGVRSQRELVRHRHKLVQISSSVKAQVHAVLAKCGITVGVSDLFGVAGMARLQQLVLPEVFRIRVDSQLRLLAAVESEIIAVDRLIRRELAADPGYRVIQQIPGVGPVVAAIMVAELGEVTRFAGPAQLASWARLTPRHRESDTTVHRGPITRLVRWAAIEAVQHARKAV